MPFPTGGGGGGNARRGPQRTLLWVAGYRGKHCTELSVRFTFIFLIVVVVLVLYLFAFCSHAAKSQS